MPDLPPFPAAYAYPPNALSRSQSSSPAQPMTSLPMRTATQSPQVQQQRLTQNMSPRGIPMQYPPAPQGLQQMTQQVGNGYGGMNGVNGMHHQPDVRVPSGLQVPQLGPPMEHLPAQAQTGQGSQGSGSLPTQLKVKVHCPSAGSSMSFVVSMNISYQSLKDRIDVKLQRSTNLSLSSGHVKLKYLDEDDYVSIQSDEDVQMAFETWRESQRGHSVGTIGEIELFIQ